MRIRIAGVFTLAALTLATAACGSGDDTPSAGESAKPAGGTLTIWADDQRAAALKPFAETFGKTNGVTVEVQAVSKDLQTNYVTAAQSGKGPDIVVGAHDWIGNLVQNGTIDPVQLTDQQKAGFAEVALKAVTFNGQVYGVPYAIENLALIRNTDLAPAAPASIEELVAAGKSLKDAGKVTNIMSLQVGNTGDAYHVYPLFSSAGGYLFGTKANGDYDPSDLGVGKPQSVEAFKKIAALGEKGSGALTRSVNGDNAIPTFTGGKTAFLISGPWAVADIKKAGVKYDITPIPAFSGGKAAQPFVGVQAFYVASKGKSKALANEFITNYLTKPDLQVALYQANPRPPALTAALDQVKSGDADIEKWLNAGKGGAVLPAIPAMAAVWDPFGKAEAAIVGGADVQTTLDAASKSITDAINK
ncbi:extracellular solute-binding protein [Dactylosporangium sucinum]|uniref:Sugar ABC transporter substrate-binding protein n=1 Tax=Dactylosporangium sucinum TaxID=1424081 RepID=A0A917UAU9_9ACTN|nr:maltose ABC transporter substrate-binding protein [Dactylosporangium sucinum]GGM71945.1 sugar ABC transporter substrate-binding protein [Dactylosporangium sucinum]